MDISKTPFLDHWMNKVLGPFVTIFTIHRASPENKAYGGLDEKLLEQCLAYATQKGYRFASVDQLVEEALSGQPIRQPTISFTLDDGYDDQVTRLLPILLRHRASPTLFVITDFLDGKTWPWDAKINHLIWNTRKEAINLSIGSHQLSLDLGSAENRKIARRQLNREFNPLNSEEQAHYLRVLAERCELPITESAPQQFMPTSWQALRDLEASGLRVGSHTQTHLVLSAASNETISNELVNSKARLSQELQNPSSVFCYPLGTKTDFNLSNIQLIQNAGYRSAVTTVANVTSIMSIKRNPYQIQRIGIPSSFEKFVRYISWKEALRSKLPF